MILCGTDLSPASEAVLQAAGALAKKQGRELLLAHVLERDDPNQRMTCEMQLEQDAADLRRNLDISVETLVVTGVPEQRLLELVKKRSAQLLVVGAEGKAQHQRRLGSVPEHLCQHCSVPVLVVRKSEGLRAWADGKQPLSVLLGSGMGDASTSALEYVAGWPDLSLTVAHVAWPYGEHYRLGVGSPMPLDHLRPEVHHQLVGDLGRWIAAAHCANTPKLKVVPGWGRIDSHLAQLAQEKAADLLVVGSHQRNLAARVWHGSVSRSAIHEASCNVLCVPQRFAEPRIAPAPRVLVVPTDFSALADRAIAVAYGLAGVGGRVHLVHVSGDDDEARAKTLLEQLRERIPSEAEARGIGTELHVLPSKDAWLAIWQHASRHGADLICMATHSRDAAGSLLLGSQAQSLLQHARVPVLLVPPDRES